MSEPIEPIDWEARLVRSIAVYRTKRARMEAFKRERARLRRYGLRSRYRQKLAYLEQRDSGERDKL